MKNNNLYLIGLSLVLVFLDIAFFSFLDLYGGTIFLSLVVVILVSLFWGQQKTLIFGLSSMIFLTILSSLPLIVILVGFLLVPMFIAFLRKRVLPELPVIGAVPIIVAPLIIFELCFIIVTGSYFVGAFLTASFFVVLNATIGIWAYGVIQNIGRKQRIGIFK
ncbi:MAG: hypothetical protein WCG48_00420 [Candidatus Berkelbacteria bacterium]